ncbi:LCP family protein [Aquibacillus kalidii]|uniref:LCP family protein n=1 Tax=Aquibacillus kalidii TaxID=2762597 RepID=UPI001648A43B|nr:LCP family protein [Aquibacillus kalidii]
MNEKRIHRKKNKSWKKRLLYIFLFFLLVVIGIGAYVFIEAYQAADNSFEDLQRAGDKSELREEKVTIGDDPISILLLGIEDYSSNGKNGRADTQIVVTLNPDTNKMTMTTINRDTRVELTRVEKYAGFHKINAAYTFGELSGYGGNKHAVEAVEDLLDIPIDKYVAVNFEGFRDIVDVFGGVTIDIKEAFWEKNIYDNNNRIYFEQGPAHLNGEEALAFVRMRKRDVNAIYSREERQRQFIQATIDEAISAGTILKVGEISDVLGKNVQTNLKPKEIYALEQAYSSMDPDSIETLEIEGNPNEYIGKYSYFVPYEESLTEVSQRLKSELGLSNSELTDNNTTQSIE